MCHCISSPLPPPRALTNPWPLCVLLHLDEHLRVKSTGGIHPSFPRRSWPVGPPMGVQGQALWGEGAGHLGGPWPGSLVLVARRQDRQTGRERGLACSSILGCRPGLHCTHRWEDLFCPSGRAAGRGPGLGCPGCELWGDRSLLPPRIGPRVLFHIVWAGACVFPSPVCF